MYIDGVQAVGEQAAVKLEQQRRSLLGHLVRSALAGMYVGIAVVLILTIGGFLPKETQKLVMGVCFGGALFVAGVYWVGSPKARELARMRRVSVETNGEGDAREILPPLPVKEAV